MYSHYLSLENLIILKIFFLIRRGLNYVCHSLLCPLGDRKRQKFVMFDIEQPYNCEHGE